MANFASVANVLEGIINNQLTFARHNQGIWEWYNALSRIMSANRFSGTPRVVSSAVIGGTGAADVDIEAGAVRLFGVLADNSMAAEDAYVLLYNTATVTEGTTDTLGALWVARATIGTYVFCDGIAFDTAFTASGSIGTEAGLEAGTLNTTAMTAVFVYTE